MGGKKTGFKTLKPSLVNGKPTHEVGAVNSELVIDQTGTVLNNNKSNEKRNNKLESNSYKNNSRGLSYVNTEAFLIEKSSQSDTRHYHRSSYIHKDVRIVEGRCKGICGKIVNTDNYGWLILDNEILQGRKVHSDQCRFIDISGKVIEGDLQMLSVESDQGQQKCAEMEISDGTSPRVNNGNSVTQDNISKAQHNFIEMKNRKLPKKFKDADIQDQSSNIDQEITRRTRLRRAAAPRVSYRSDGEYLTGTFPARKENNILVKETRSQSANIKSNSGMDEQIPESNIGTSTKVLSNSTSQYQKSRKRSPQHIPFHPEKGMKQMRNMLPPVVIDSHNNNIVPDVLRHLPPTCKINIFNRRSGKIMRGNDAVSVKDLSSVLMNHAEYEPIVPLSKTTIQNSQATTISSDHLEMRNARSSLNTGISETVQPQSRVRGSAVEGKLVVVKKGPYVGMMGKVEACIPGGWYMVSDILNEDKLNLDVVVHSSKLELVPDEKFNKIEPAPTLRIVDRNQGTNQKYIQNSRSRLNNLEKEKVLLLTLITKCSMGEKLQTTKDGEYDIDIIMKEIGGVKETHLCSSVDKIESARYKVSDELNRENSVGKDVVIDIVPSKVHLRHLNDTLGRVCKNITKQKQLLQEHLLAGKMLERDKRIPRQTRKVKRSLH